VRLRNIYTKIFWKLEQKNRRNLPCTVINNSPPAGGGAKIVETWNKIILSTMLLHRLSLASRSLALAPMANRALHSNPLTPIIVHRQFSSALTVVGLQHLAGMHYSSPAASPLPTGQRSLMSWARRPTSTAQAGVSVRGLIGGLGGGLLRVPSGDGMAGGVSRQPPVAWESVKRKRKSKMNKVRATLVRKD